MSSIVLYFYDDNKKMNIKSKMKKDRVEQSKVAH